MGQSLCALDGYTFPYNPYPYVNAPNKVVSHTVTQGGGVNTIWQPPSGGVFVQDQMPDMSYDLIDMDFYATLLTKFEKPGALLFVDPFGQSCWKPQQPSPCPRSSKRHKFRVTMAGLTRWTYP